MAEITIRKEKAVSGTSKSKAVASYNRRYVGSRETLAYVVYDISQSFNISKYQDVFITDVVQIGLSFQTLVNFIIGIWDVINDIFLAAVVDKANEIETEVNNG